MHRPPTDQDALAPWSLLGDVETNVAAVAGEHVDQDERPWCSLEESASASERWLHAKWWNHRRRVIQAMHLAGESDRAIQRVRDCGKYATVQRCTTTQELRVRGSKCRHRFCRRCAQATALNVADNLADLVKKAELRCSHVVLTLKHRQEELHDTRQRLYKAFRDLRQLPTWKRLVKGGAAFCQMHVSKRDRRWHVHFHIIAEHKYLPQEELSAMWLQVTGDSSNVWIERVDRVDDVVKEATRYVASPIDKTTARNIGHLAAAIATCRGARLCFTFGTWRGTQLHAKRTEPELLEWVDVANLGDVIFLASQGDEESKRMLRELLGSQITETGPPELFEPT